MNEQETQSTRKQWRRDDDLNRVVSELREGDEVIVQDRSLALTVFEKCDERVGSDTYETHMAYLEGRAGRVYRLRGEYAPDTELRGHYETPPRLELRKEGEWDCKRSSVTKLAVENWGKRITSDMSAEEFIAPTVGVASWAVDYAPPLREVEGDRIGECPDCGSAVVEQDNQATCVACPLWCPVDEWHAHSSKGAL